MIFGGSSDVSDVENGPFSITQLWGTSQYLGRWHSPSSLIGGIIRGNWDLPSIAYLFGDVSQLLLGDERRRIDHFDLKAIKRECGRWVFLIEGRVGVVKVDCADSLDKGTLVRHVDCQLGSAMAHELCDPAALESPIVLKSSIWWPPSAPSFLNATQDAR